MKQSRVTRRDQILSEPSTVFLRAPGAIRTATATSATTVTSARSGCVPVLQKAIRDATADDSFVPAVREAESRLQSAIGQVR